MNTLAVEVDFREGTPRSHCRHPPSQGVHNATFLARDKGESVARRLSSVVPLVLAASLCLVAAPAASAATTAPLFFSHDDTLDDDPATEVHSGLFQAFNFDASAQPDAQRAESLATANELGETDEDNPTYEKFPFDIPEGDENGSFTVTVTWGEPAIDFDVAVYKERDNGTLDPNPVATAASTADPERAIAFPALASEPLPAGRYWVYVDNWCSNDNDPLIEAFLDGSCTGDPDAPLSNEDEDDFIGQVTFSAFTPDNKVPTATLSGPDTAETLQSTTFTASGTDTDGTISSYAFDLDGDGRFEYDNGRSPTVSTRFLNAGVYSVGVRVADDRGATAYATKTVTVSGPSTGATPGKAAALGLLSSFKLNRPVFGGKKRNKLVVSYRLREAGRTIVSLYRGKKKVKRLAIGNRRANRTYKINISPKKLRKGATYTVRMFVRSADGKRTQSVRLSAKRL
jgi:hypothetical protein